MFKGVAKGIRTNSAYAPGSRARKGVVPGLFRRFAANIKYLRFTFILYSDFVGAGFGFFFTKATGNVAYWNFGDGQGVASNAPTITYTAVGDKKIICRIDDPALVTGFSQFSGSGLIGILDLRKFTGLTVNATILATSNPRLRKMLFPALNVNLGSVGAGFCDLQGVVDLSMLNGNFQQIIFSGNPKLTQIVLPKFGKTCGYFYVSNCNLNGTLDTRGLTLNGYFDVGGNNFQQVYFDAGGGVFNSGFYINSCPYLEGPLDLSMLPGMGVDIRLGGNPKLKGITFPTSTQAASPVQMDGNTTMTSIDVSGFSALNGYFSASGCSSVTSFTFPTSSGFFTNINLFGCNITGTLNLSGLSGLGGTLQFSNNSLLTGFTFPASISGSANATTLFTANSCNLTGTLNLSAITKLTGDLSVSNNILLTAITLPSNTLAMTSFAAVNCAVVTVNFTSMPKLTEINGCTISLVSNGMTAAQVNTILIDLDTNATNAFTGRSIIINGANAAPTGLGLTAKASLITKGFTVTSN